MGNLMRRERRTSFFPVSLRTIFAVLFVLLIGIVGLTVTYRLSGLGWRTLFFPSGQTDEALLSYTVWQVRLPRVVVAITLGAALAVAGCLLQAMTRNDLSDPEIMGLNQGASLFAVGALMVFGETDTNNLILAAAMCGAGLSGLLVMYIARYGRSDPSRLVLSGVAISAFLGALTTGTILLFETRLTEILYWMAGKLSGTEWRDAYLVWLLDIPALIIAYMLAHTLNVMAQGEDTASGLGVNVRRIRGIVSVLVMVLIGSTVGVAGPIGFVGLIVPHMARRIGGPDYRVVLPLSVMSGAVLLSAADFASQWVSYPSEIPVGILTAIMGVPFFLYLLRRGKEKR